MNEEQIRGLIREELDAYFKAREVLFHKNIRFMDNIDIQVGRSHGTTIGTASDQKVGVYGMKTTQAGAIGEPTGGLVNDGEARSAINSIIAALHNFGIIA